MSIRLNQTAAIKFIKLECESVGKNAVFHEEGFTTPYTDGTTIHLRTPEATWSEEEWQMWEYEIYHEIGHESPENGKPHWRTVVEEKKIASKTMFGNVMNIISDHISEHNRVGVFEGRDEVLLHGRYRFLTEKVFSKEFRDPPQSPESAKIAAIFLYDTLCREKWNDEVKGLAESVADTVHPDVREAYEKLKEGGVEVHKGENEWDSYEITKKLLDDCGDDSEKREQEAKDVFEKLEAMKGGTGKGKGKVAEGEEVEGELAEGEGIPVLCPHYSKPERGEDGRPPEEASIIDYSRVKNVDYSFPYREPLVLDMKKKTISPELAHRYPPRGAEVNRNRTEITEMCTTDLLSRQLRALIISKQHSRYIHGKKRGKVSAKTLWKAHSPLYNQKVFKRREVEVAKNTAITVLVDNSGSMRGGQKYTQACVAGVMLCRALTKARIPVELLNFTEFGEGVLNIIIKPFTEVVIAEEELIDRYAQTGSYLCQNSDGESISWAVKRLAKREEERRVLIVLSDGSPACYHGESGSEYFYTKEVIKSIEASPIEIYGIGICDDNVQKLYKEWSVLHSPEQLEKVLLDVVKKKVLEM